MTYATLADVQAELKANTNLTQPNAPEVLNGNQYVLEALRFVTKRIDFYKHQEYAPRRQVRYFDAPPFIVLDPNLRCVILDRPLVDVVTATFADTVLSQWTPDQSFASRATCDYYLTPVGRTPYRLLYPTEQWQTWTPLALYGSPVQQVVKLDALWCYRTYYSTDAWTDSEQVVLNTPLSVSGKVVNVADASVFSPGMWIRFEDQSPVAADEIAEVVSVDSFTSPQTITLLRGGAAARGTTPTEHAADCPIGIWQPEPNVVRCAQRWAAYLYNRRATYEQLRVTVGSSGSISQVFPMDVPEECAGILADLPVFGTYTIGSMDRDG